MYQKGCKVKVKGNSLKNSNFKLTRISFQHLSFFGTTFEYFALQTGLRWPIAGITVAGGEEDGGG